MYVAIHPVTLHEVTTDFMGEACLYHCIGYIIFDYHHLVR